MHTISSISKLRKILSAARRKGKSIGFVPTMGALHAGHSALIKKARRETDVVIISIFVNPKQFGPGEDYKKYPREKSKDCLFAKKENVDIIFYPSEKEVYPRSFLTSIKISGLTKNLCGRFRPGHFDGVALIVAKLLNIVTPDTLYLGQKDYQQCMMLKRMVEDLNIPVALKICPTVRERDGLALSSRNKYLTSQQRREAPVLYRSLRLAKKMIAGKERKTDKITRAMRDLIRQNSRARIQYIECVDPKTLQPVKKIKGPVVVALAAWLEKARLIDNILVR